MKRYAVIAASIGIGLSVSLASLADPPKRLRVVETIQLKAPVDTVWATVKDFDSLGKWHPAVAKDEIIKGTNNKPGALRELTIKDGPKLKEELISFAESAHTFSYKITESPFPITNYRSTLSVKAGKDGATVVRWVGTFKRKNPADPAPEAESDAAGIKLITGIYQAGLGNLKKMLGG